MHQYITTANQAKVQLTQAKNLNCLNLLDVLEFYIQFQCLNGPWYLYDKLNLFSSINKIYYPSKRKKKEALLALKVIKIGNLPPFKCTWISR